MSNKKTSSVNKSDSVDQIRNILFGEQIAIIEKRFSELEKRLLKTIDKLAEKLNQTNITLSNQIEKSNEQLQSDSLGLAQQQSEQLKNLELTISNKIIETESDIVNQLQTGLEKLDNKASHRNELATLLNQMAEKLVD